MCFGTVAYNNPTDIASWVNHIRALPGGESVHIAVSDNSTDSTLADEIKNIIHDASASYYGDGVNSGYFSGLNKILTNNPGFYFYILGNSDLSYCENFIASLYGLGRLRWDIIAPRILTDTGRDLNPYMLEQEREVERWLLRAKFSSYPLYLCYAIFYRLGFIPFFEHICHHRPVVSRGSRQEIWAAHGSCFVIGQSYLSKCKELPVRTFLWLEENVLAVYAKINNATIVYYPELLVHHTGRGTTNGMERRQKYTIKKQSFYSYLAILKEYRDHLKRDS